MFSVEERDLVREKLLAAAEADIRIVAGALIGSIAGGGGDRWSDLDLGFGVAEGASVAEVLAEWTDDVERRFDAVHLFDQPFQASIYRVFLFPGSLQVDLSFTPAAEFGAFGPKFQLLFGAAVERPAPTRPSAQHLFGLGVHHAVRARICIERGRLWQAQHWIAGVRDEALSLACLRHGHEVSYGRGFDELPRDVLDRFADTMVTSIERAELLRALRSVIAELLHEGDGMSDIAPLVAVQLRGLGATDLEAPG